MNQSVGILRYSPKLLGDRASEKWWLVLDCDESLGCYYRHLYWLAHFRVQKLLRPAWKEHVTVIRNEEPPHKGGWEKYTGKSVEFEYNPEPRTNGSYWWLEVCSRELQEIRVELGLSREPAIPLHLSFGHQQGSNHEGS